MTENEITAEKVQNNWRLYVNKLKKWWFVIGALLLIAITIWLVIFPQVLRIMEYQKEVASKQDELMKLRNKRIALERLNEEEVARSQGIVEAVLPQQKPVFSALAVLEQQAAASGVSLVEYSVFPGKLDGESKAPSKKSGLMSTIEMKAVVRGPLIMVNEFMKRIEQSAPLMEVQNIQISKSRKIEGVEGVAYEGGITLMIYYATLPTTEAASAVVSVGMSKEAEKTIASVSGYFVPVSTASGEVVLDPNKLPKEDLFAF